MPKTLEEAISCKIERLQNQVTFYRKLLEDRELELGKARAEIERLRVQVLRLRAKVIEYENYGV
jgi:hypothetical protein